MEEKGPLLSPHTYTINRKSIKLVAREDVVKCFGATAEKSFERGWVIILQNGRLRL